MTKKDFELIARTIRSLSFISDEENGLEGSEPGSTRSYVAEVFASRLADTNPRFDRDRFVAAATAGPLQ